MSSERGSRSTARDHARRERESAEVVIRGVDDDTVLIRVPEATATAVRYFLARLGQNGGVPRTLGISSALRGEGVTFVSRAVGAVLANDYRVNVCVVDFNWNQSGDGDGDVGLADVLREECDLRGAVLPTSDECFTLLPAGSVPAGEQPLLTRSSNVKTVMEDLAAEYDHVILDLPPVLATSDAVLLGANADAIALVVRHGVTTERQLEQALSVVQPMRMLGVILNRTSSRVPPRLRRLFPSW